MPHSLVETARLSPLLQPSLVTLVGAGLRLQCAWHRACRALRQCATKVTLDHWLNEATCLSSCTYLVSRVRLARMYRILWRHEFWLDSARIKLCRKAHDFNTFALKLRQCWSPFSCNLSHILAVRYRQRQRSNDHCDGVEHSSAYL